MSKLLARLRSQQGFTLVEASITMAILLVISLATATLITSMFEANIRSSQVFSAQSGAENASRNMLSRFQAAELPIGMLCANGTDPGCGATGQINRLSIAGDQIVFLDKKTNKCTRIFYERNQKRIRGKVSTSCTNADIKPVRGPNQNGGAKVAYGQTGYDPALDLEPGQTDAAGNVGAFVIADKVASDRPDTAPSDYPNPLQLFIYQDSGASTLGSVSGQSGGSNPGPDAVANSASANTWYATGANRSQVNSALVTTYTDATVTSASRVKAVVHRDTVVFGSTGSGSGSGSGAAVAGVTDGVALTNSSSRLIPWQCGLNQAGSPTLHYLNWNHEVYDNSSGGSYHSPSDPSVITVPRTGKYSIDFSVALDREVSSSRGPTAPGQHPDRSGWIQMRRAKLYVMVNRTTAAWQRDFAPRAFATVDDWWNYDAGPGYYDMWGYVGVSTTNTGPTYRTYRIGNTVVQLNAGDKVELAISNQVDGTINNVNYEFWRSHCNLFQNASAVWGTPDFYVQPSPVTDTNQPSIDNTYLGVSALN